MVQHGSYRRHLLKIRTQIKYIIFVPCLANHDEWQSIYCTQYDKFYAPSLKIHAYNNLKFCNTRNRPNNVMKYNTTWMFCIIYIWNYYFLNKILKIYLNLKIFLQSIQHVLCNKFIQSPVVICHSLLQLISIFNFLIQLHLTTKPTHALLIILAIHHKSKQKVSTCLQLFKVNKVYTVKTIYHSHITHERLHIMQLS